MNMLLIPLKFSNAVPISMRKLITTKTLKNKSVLVVFLKRNKATRQGINADQNEAANKYSEYFNYKPFRVFFVPQYDGQG